MPIQPTTSAGAVRSADQAVAPAPAMRTRAAATVSPIRNHEMADTRPPMAKRCQSRSVVQRAGPPPGAGVEGKRHAAEQRQASADARRERRLQQQAQRNRRRSDRQSSDGGARCGPAAIRAPITVGKKCSSVVAITTETNPIRLSRVRAAAAVPDLQERPPARHEQDGEARAERDVHQRSDVPTGHDAGFRARARGRADEAWPRRPAPRPR